MALSRLKVWLAGEVLTAADLNGEFNNILNNGVDLWSPANKAADMNGFELILDANGDTSITADTDDQIDFRLGGTDLFRLTTAHLQLLGDQPIVDSSGNEFIKFSKTASAVNELTISNAATGNPPSMSATGGDTNISINLVPKGTGTLLVNGVGVQPLDADLTALAALSGTDTIYYRSAASTWTAVTIGSGISFSSGTLSSSGVIPKGLIYGVTLSNNGSDATNDIDIAAGQVTDSTGAVVITATAMTKRLDANWAAGTAQGFRNSAAAITDTTYHIYAVSKALGADPDYYAHTSATVATVITALQAETGGTNYIYARRIGSILRESATIVAFSQLGDEFRRLSGVLDVNLNNPGTSAVTRTLSVPLGIKVHAVINMGFDGGTGGGVMYLSPLDANDDAASDGAAAPLGNIGLVDNADADSRVFCQIAIRTNTSGQIRSRATASNASTSMMMATLGWLDTRERNG